MNSNAAYIFPSELFHPEKISSNLNGFKEEDILFLAATLYLNILENLDGKKDKLDVYCIWDENEKDNLPEELKNCNCNIIFIDVSKQKELFEKFSTKEFLSHKNNLVVFSDVINLKPNDYDQYFKLLSAENESLVIAKNKEGSIAAFGFNKYSEDIFSGLITSKFNYDDFLGKIKSSEHFMQIVSDVLIVKNINNFKQLYFELSQKKSQVYCSQQMHERFTHLFVEYKDLLK
ncbi:MAG: hypothetical protein ABI638_02445 [Ignavibacteriota bacterium]